MTNELCEVRTSADADVAKNVPESGAPDGLMFIDDVCAYLRCGRSKAAHVMEQVGPVRIGAAKAVFRSDLIGHIREHGGVQVVWPKRRGRLS